MGCSSSKSAQTKDQDSTLVSASQRVSEDQFKSQRSVFCSYKSGISARESSITSMGKSYREEEKELVQRILYPDPNFSDGGIDFAELTLTKRVEVTPVGETIKGTYLGKPVMITRLSRVLIKDISLQLLTKEVDYLSRLSHPNLLKFYGVTCNTFSNICIIMEYLCKGTLMEALKNTENELSWARLKLEMAMDIARGMAYLHEPQNDKVHKNLSSKSIRVGDNFVCKIADYENCRNASVDSTVSIRDNTNWMAPETFKREETSQKSDVYSFGIVLSELDTRKAPYYHRKHSNGKPMKGTVIMHSVCFDPSFRPILSDACPSALKRLYLQCVHENPDMRPDFKTILAELDGAVRKEVSSS